MWVSNFVKRKDGVDVGISIDSNYLRYVIRSKQVSKNLLDYGEFSADDISESLMKIKKLLPGNVNCFLVLPHRFVMLKNLYFEETFREKEIHNLLTLNAERYFSCSLKKLNFDYEFLDMSKRRVRIMAGRKEDIENWMNFFKETALNLSMVTADVLVVEDFIWRNQVIQKDTVSAVFIVDKTRVLQIITSEQVLELAALDVEKDASIDLPEEIKKFIRLYETSKPTRHKIEEIIIFGDVPSIVNRELKEKLKIKFRYYRTLDFLGFSGLSMSYLLPFAVLLLC